MNPDDGTSYGTLFLALITGVFGLLGGGFGIGLVNSWKERSKNQARVAETRGKAIATNEANAREWLTDQLKERDKEVEAVRLRELQMVQELGELKASIARLEEQLKGTLVQVDLLRSQSEKWGIDFSEMKKERDYYRDKKHDSDQRLTSESLRAQLSERNLVEAHKEIDRLKGQVEVLNSRFPVLPMEEHSS